MGSGLQHWVCEKVDLPKTYQDLLDPKWKGRLGYEVENIDWFVTVVQSMGEAKGLQFFATWHRPMASPFEKATPI